MQPCQVCGTTGIDANGYCERCQLHSGAESYSVSPPAGAFYQSAASGVAGRASVAAYPVVTSGPPADTGYPPPVEARPARSPLVVPLFMLTVIVIALVSGTVAVVLVRENGRSAAPRANVPQAASTTAPAPSASAPPSTAPSTSSTVDKCLVGEWTVTTWRLPYTYSGSDGEVATSNGGVVRFRADGTGEWDFGSGIKLVGSGAIRTVAIRLTGRFTFSFRTTGQTFEFNDVRADARHELTDSERVVNAGAWNPDLSTYGYACAGDIFRWSPDERYEVRLQRRG